MGARAKASIIGVAVVGAVASWWFFGRSSVEVVDSVSIGNFYDWNLAKPGHVADSTRELTAERLFERGSDGRLIYRLAGALEHETDLAKVTLKDSVYWSDLVQVNAGHVVDAWFRVKARLASEPDLVDSPEERSWFQKIEVKQVGKLGIEFAGPASKEELERLLCSRFLMPIRKDLIDQDESSPGAWQVTVGRYRLSGLTPSLYLKTGFVEFSPNPSFYRGAATEPTKVAVQNK